MKISVIGAGTWGACLANVLSENGHEVIIWGRNIQSINAMESSLKHPNLTSFTYSKKIKFFTDINDALDSEILVIAVPTSSIRSVISKMKSTNKLIKSKFVIASKGIENDTCFTISEILENTLSIDSELIYVLSGPSHAEEVIQKHPTTVVIANSLISNAREMQSIFSNKYFRVYSSDDLLGVQLGGSIKNVIAIAAGICSGMGYGDNALSALTVRGLEEISHLANKMGAKKTTVFGISGCGDLIATAFSKHSRNRFVGERLGNGDSLDNILVQMNMVAEGVNTTKSIHQLSEKNDIQMPICNEIYNIIFKNKKPDQAIGDLMSRELVDEKIERN